MCGNLDTVLIAQIWFPTWLDEINIYESLSAATSVWAALWSSKASVFLIIGSTWPYLRIKQWNRVLCFFFLKMENRWVWKSDNVGIIGWLRVLQLYFYRKSFTFMNKQYICRFRVCQSCHCYLTCGSVPGPAASCHPLQRLMDRCHFRGLLQKCSPAEIL